MQAGGRRFDPGWLHCVKSFVPNDLAFAFLARNFAVFSAFFVPGRKMKNRLPKICRRADRNLVYVTLRGRKVYLGKYGSPESYAEYERVIAEYLTSPLVEAGPDCLLSEFASAFLAHARDITSKTASRPSKPNVFAPRSPRFSLRRSTVFAFATSTSSDFERFSATGKTRGVIAVRISTRLSSAFAPRSNGASPKGTSIRPFWSGFKPRRRSNGGAPSLAKPFR